MKKISAKRLNRSFQVDLAIFLFLGLLAALMVFPLIFAIAHSFKPLSELFLFPPRFFPMNPTTQNYRDLFALMSNSWVPFSRYIFNTVFITLVGTTGHIIFASMCAYPMALYKFPGSKTFYNLILLALMFSATVTMVPNFLIMTRLGWLDTHLAILVPYFASPLGLFLMKPFIAQNVAPSLVESAKVDGFNAWHIYWYIVMPLIKPAWLTLVVFSVQALWGLGPSIFIYTEELKTLVFAMGQIVTGGIARAGVGAAIAVVMMFVPITVFIITQSKVVETMSTSGIKE